MVPDVFALMNAPGHMEDHQVVAFLAGRLRARDVPAEVISPSQLRWENGDARVGDTRVAAIFRFYQGEWLARLPSSIAWRPLFVNARTPIANPGVAALSV